MTKNNKTQDTQFIEENNALYQEMKKQFQDGDFSGFIDNIEHAQQKGFITDKQYKKHMKMLRGMLKTANMKDDVKHKLKTSWDRFRNKQ